MKQIIEFAAGSKEALHLNDYLVMDYSIAAGNITVYPVEDEWVVADASGWIDGVYSTVEDALQAALWVPDQDGDWE